MLKLIAVAVAGLLTVQVARCALDPAPAGPIVSVSIADLLRQPGSYDGRTVTFRGVVKDRLSLLGASAYRLSGADGETLLVLGLTTAPHPGESTAVTGIFRMAATIGDLQAPIVVSK